LAQETAASAAVFILAVPIRVAEAICGFFSSTIKELPAS
jgi:hypothetical protein